MRTILSYEREIFKKLYSADGPVDVYDFFVQFKLSPGHIAKFLKNSEQKQLILFNDGSMTLTESGRKFVVDHKDEIYMKNLRPWRKIPDHMTLDEQYSSKGRIFDFSKNDIKSFLKY